MERTFEHLWPMPDKKAEDFYRKMLRKTRKNIKGSVKDHIIITCNPTGDFFYNNFVNESNKRNYRQETGE